MWLLDAAFRCWTHLFSHRISLPVREGIMDLHFKVCDDGHSKFFFVHNSLSDLHLAFSHPLHVFLFLTFCSFALALWIFECNFGGFSRCFTVFVKKHSDRLNQESVRRYLASSVSFTLHLSEIQFSFSGKFVVPLSNLTLGDFQLGARPSCLFMFRDICIYDYTNVGLEYFNACQTCRTFGFFSNT